MSAHRVKRAMRVKAESKFVLKGTPPWSGITQRRLEFPPMGELILINIYAISSRLYMSAASGKEPTCHCRRRKKSVFDP